MDDQTNLTPVVASQSNSIGPAITGVVILAVVIFGVLYFWSQRDTTESLNQQVDTIRVQGESDSVSDLETDLNSTDVENLDAELDAS